MIKVEINYNPYFMKTLIKINGQNICENSNYSRFHRYINANMPMQTWIEPIAHDEWNGFLEEIISDSGETKLDITFKGRKIDFNDLNKALEVQNNEREDENKISISYTKEITISDNQLSTDIDYVVQQMLSDEFKLLVDERKSDYLREKYSLLEENYKRARGKEFKIIFAGLYSSGKSTLINSILGKNILPTSDRTCTSNVFKIRHSKDVEYAEMICFDENSEIVVDKEIFYNDDEINNRILQLMDESNKSDLNKRIDTIEIYTNLLHLYPEGFEDKFNIVIVDTPGTNSGEGNGSSQSQKHIDITLDAIQEKDKEMVVLVVDGQDYQDESITDLLDSIDNAIKKDSGGFNDRFLFIMNKCDNKRYKNGEKILTAIDEYADYLNIGNDGNSSRIISPRIFPVCAIAAMAIKKGYTTEESVYSEESEDMYSAYNTFRDKTQKKFGADNFHFEKYCSTSELIKDNMISSINNAKENNDEETEVLIHSGIPSVEVAIKEYIERYAFPIKVKDLLNTFKSILDEVKQINDVQIKKLKEALLKLGDIKKERCDEEVKKLNENKNKNRLLTGREEIKKLQIEVAEIQFDIGRINKIKAIANSEIFENESIVKYREKTIVLNKLEAEKIVVNINDIINKSLEHIRAEFKKIQEENNILTESILNKLKMELRKLNENGLFNMEGIDFTKTVAFNSYLNIGSVDELRQCIREESKTVHKRNPIKEQNFKFYQLFKHIKKAFAPDFISEEHKTYDISFINTVINKLTIDFDIMADEIEEAFKEDINKIKEAVSKRLNDVIELIESSNSEISELEDRIRKIINDAEKVSKEKEKLEVRSKWLEEIANKIENISM